MTVSFTDSRWDYIQTLPLLDTFQYACEIYLKTDLKVYVSGILQEVDTHYIVTGSPPLYGINNPDGGNIVFYPDYIPANLVPIAIILDLPLTQLTDYKEGDKFPAETHERALDRLIKIAQQFNNVLGRILKIPFWSTLSNILVEIGAGKYLRWNAEGTSIICDSGTTVGAHKGTHEDGGADEISAVGLLGVTSHPHSITGYSGLLADDQHVLESEVISAAKTIKLDDFASPDDNIDLDVNTSKHGLCPKAPNDTAKFLRGDGSWNPPSEAPTAFTAGDLYQGGQLTEGNVDNLNYTKVKSIRLDRGGTIRTYFEICTSNYVFPVYGRIYRNGVGVGTERSTQNVAYVGYTEDIVGWAQGDTYELYVHHAGGSGQLVYFQNFMIFAGIQLILTGEIGFEKVT